MNEEQRNAQVIISADTAQYQQSVQAAAQQTSQLTAVVDKLSSSLDGLTKKAGNRLMIGSAAGIASFTAAAKVADSYKNSLSGLNAQATYTNLNVEKLNKGMSGIAQKWGVSRTQVVGLAEAFTKLGQVTSDKKLTSMLNTGFKLGGATGEDVTSVSTALLELNRSMSTANPEQYEKFAGALSKVSATSGSSATGVASFAQALAPIGKMAGITENELLGISASFQQAGADGFYAANTFNSVVSDITRQIQYGSPEINKYASLLGMTREEFKELGTTEGVVQLFEYIGKQGPEAVKILDDLGQDGIRAAKAITAVSQTGGLRKNILAAESGYEDPSQMNTAAEEYYSSWSRSLTKVGEQFKEITVNFGQTFLPIAKTATDAFSLVLGVVEKITNVLDGIMGNPFGALATGALVFAGAVGLVLRNMKLLSGLATAKWLTGTTPVQAFLGGRADAKVLPGRILPDARDNTQRAVRAGTAGPFANFWANTGARTVPGWTPERAAEAQARREAGRRGPSMLSRVAAVPFRAAAWVADGQTQFARDAARDGVDRKRWLPANWLGSVGNKISSFGDGTTQTVARATAAGKTAYATTLGGFADPKSKEALAAASKAAIAASYKEASAGLTNAQAKLASAVSAQQQLVALKASGGKVTSAQMIQAETSVQVAKENVGLATATRKAALATLRAGGQTALVGGQFGGSLVGKGAKGIGSALMGAGSLVGISNPYVLAGVATAGTAAWAIKSQRDESKMNKDLALSGENPLNAYETALGKSTTKITEFTSSLEKAKSVVDNKTTKDAENAATSVNFADAQRALKDRNTFNGGENLKALQKDNPELAKAYLQSFGELTPDVLSLVRDDLIKLVGADKAREILEGYKSKGQSDIPNDPSAFFKWADEENRRYQNNPLKNPFKTQSSDASKTIDLSLDQLTTRSSAVADNFGDAAGAAAQGNSLADWLGQALSAQNSDTRIAAIQQFEERFATGDLNYEATTAYDNSTGQAGPQYAMDQAAKGNFAVLDLLDPSGEATKTYKERNAAAGRVSINTPGTAPQGNWGPDNGMPSDVRVRAASEAGIDITTDPNRPIQLPKNADGTPATITVDDNGKQVLPASSPSSTAPGGMTTEDLNALLDKKEDEAKAAGVRRENEALIKSGGKNALAGQNQTIIDFQKNPGDPIKAGQATNQLAQIMGGDFAAFGRFIKDSTGAVRDLAIAAASAALKLKDINRVGAVSGSEARTGALKDNIDNALANNNISGEGGTDQIMAQFNADERTRTIEKIKMYENFNKQRAREEDAQDTTRLQQKEDFHKSMQRSEESYQRQSKRSWAAYYQSVKWQEQDYHRSVEIATRDFNQQKAYADADYQKGKDRSITDFGKSEQRSIEDYHLSVLRAERDFNKSRVRAIEDFNKTVARMVEDGAKTMYDPYQRITTKMVWDTNNLIGNLKDQARAIEEQNRNLARLKELGVSQETIDQLGLADAANAQQAARITSDLENDPSKANELNNAVGSKQKAANDAITSENNIAFRRMEEDFNQSMARSREDFAQGMNDSAADFAKGLQRNREDFKLSLERSDADKRTADTRALAQFKQSLRDQEEQFKLSLARSRTLQNQSAEYSREDHAIAMNQALADNATYIARQEAAWAIARYQANEDLNEAEADYFGNLADLNSRLNSAMEQSGSQMVGKVKSDAMAATNAVQTELVKIENYMRTIRNQSRLQQYNAGEISFDDFQKRYESPIVWNNKGKKWVDTEYGGRNAFHEGGIVNQRIDNATVAEVGPEAIIPLNSRGADYLASVFDKVVQKMSVNGRGSSVMFRGGGDVYNDYSTDVNGPITVMANDPNEMANKLAAKARLSRLTRR